MDGYMVRYTLRVSRNLIDKFAYVARYNGRTKNKELEMLLKDHIRKFEEAHGPIVLSNEEKNQ